MNARTRPIAPEERTALDALVRDVPTTRSAWLMTAGAAASIGGVLALLYWIGWLVVNGVTGRRLATNAPGSLRLGLIACVVVAILSALRWMRTAERARSRLLDDVASGQVLEERHEFDAARRFQEPEHGGLVYFLRSVDGRVFVVFDQESQDLGVRGKDPLTSPFRPASRLRLVLLPATRTAIVREFSGVPLDPGAPLELTASPKDWPESDEFCDLPWDALEERLAR